MRSVLVDKTVPPTNGVRQNVDSQLARTDKVFQRYPRETVVHKPLVNTLFYVLFYHPNDPVERVGSPLALKKAFKVST